jgi:Acetyltransferase (GNAT) domain
VWRIGNTGGLRAVRSCDRRLSQSVFWPRSPAQGASKASLPWYGRCLDRATMPSAKQPTLIERNSPVANDQAGDLASYQRWRIGGFQVSLLRGPSPVRSRLERELHHAGYALPLPHLLSWVESQRRPSDHWFLFVQDTAGRPCGAVGIHVSPSRALPGHRLLRVERFGPGIQAAAYGATLQALVSLARRDPRVLRVYVESFAFDPHIRTALESVLASAGFARLASPRCYEQTLVLPLDKDEESLLAGFHRSARQNIRNSAKQPLRLAPVVDPVYFDRLDEIAAETFARTGGRYVPVFDWARIAAVGIREPETSRLVGVFHTEKEGPASLMAFAWGCGHGDHVHYSFSGSTRNTERRIPLLYPLLWDLIVWAKRSGARVFDFGGVTAGTLTSGDPLGGISDFKRYFTSAQLQVGAEWSYEPRPGRAHAARMVKSAATKLSRMIAHA